MGSLSDARRTGCGFFAQPDQLGEWFRVPTPDWETVRWAWDKRNTYHLAKKLGIPTPATSYPENSNS